MMNKRTWRALGIPALVLVAACNNQPTAPAGGLVAEGGSGGSEAKPPAALFHTVTFQPGPFQVGSLTHNATIDGAGSMTGSISGSPLSNTLRAVVSGEYTWTIISVEDNSLCIGPDLDDLESRGLVGSAVKGILSFDANQKTSSGHRVDLRMTGVLPLNGSWPPGESWEIAGNSTINFPAVISGDSSSVEVRMFNYVMGFKLNPHGRTGSERMITCRVNFRTTITPPV